MDHAGFREVAHFRIMIFCVSLNGGTQEAFEYRHNGALEGGRCYLHPRRKGRTAIPCAGKGHLSVARNDTDEEVCHNDPKDHRNKDRDHRERGKVTDRDRISGMSKRHSTCYSSFESRCNALDQWGEGACTDPEKKCKKREEGHGDPHQKIALMHLFMRFSA